MKLHLPKTFPYRGAGILFFTGQGSDTRILLARRKRSRVWSIPGGARDKTDEGLWATAFRETTEEFGSVPEPRQRRFSLTFPFLVLGFHWKTFVLELPEPPPVSTYPDRNARDFVKEFSDAEWIPIHSLPPKTHWLLYPVLWRLRIKRQVW